MDTAIEMNTDFVENNSVAVKRDNMAKQPSRGVYFTEN